MSGPPSETAVAETAVDGTAVDETTPPRISAVVVHWGDAAPLRRLVAAWPRDPRFELVVVNNGPESAGELGLPPEAAVVEPGRNLGFAGGANAGAARAAAPWILLLNSDARPEPGALEALLSALDAMLDTPGRRRVAGLVPALVGDDGTSQHRWQLQPLPTPFVLLAQVFFLAGRRGPRQPPPAGVVVEQPAAAALLLRRGIFGGVLQGLDEDFYPAWFEDVDLARRLRDVDQRLIYAPQARFLHDMGSSVPALGYGPFLWIYLRHLERYLRRHHGPAWAFLARAATPVACALRILALPLRAPRRARGRVDAARALLGVALGALSGWRLPTRWARRFRPSGTAPGSSAS